MRILPFLILAFQANLCIARLTETIISKNGTELTLKCAPAEHFVRTHMAPDFENPQLVRRLDWFHDERLLASYQQVSETD